MNTKIPKDKEGKPLAPPIYRGGRNEPRSQDTRPKPPPKPPEKKSEKK
jgi:hypothetical protein